MYLLDTDTCINISRGNRSVIQTLKSFSPAQITISVFTLYEMEYGLKKATFQLKEKRRALDKIKELFNTISFGDQELLCASEIRANLEQKGTPIGSIDYLIAGCAIANSCTLVTGNVKEFTRVEGLEVVNSIQ